MTALVIGASHTSWLVARPASPTVAPYCVAAFRSNVAVRPTGAGIAVSTCASRIPAGPSVSRSGGIPSRLTPGTHPASPTQPTADAAQSACAAALLGGSPSPWTIPISSVADICEIRSRRFCGVNVPVPHPAAEAGADKASGSATASNAARTARTVMYPS